MFFKKDNLMVKVYTSCKEMALDSASDVAARIQELLKEKDSINMIFAAAPSQSLFLESLISNKDIAWERIHAFHMDEYIGMGREATQSFGNFLDRSLFKRVPFREVHYLDGLKDPATECERYARLLTQYPPDIVCLGIGENGHIAFNDPHVADFNDPYLVKVVNLDNACRQQQVNDKCFDSIEAVPTHGLTLTIPALIQAPYMYCIVPYRQKAEAVYRTLHEEISTACPASILRTKENAVLYLDGESAGRIRGSD